MDLPSTDLLRLRTAYRRGDQSRLMATAGSILASGPDHERAEAHLYLGATLAGSGRPTLAREHLAAGVALAPRAAKPSPLERRADWFEIQLVGLCIRAGLYADAAERAIRLSEPSRSLEVRLEATRAHSSILATRGDHEGAHHLLNTALGLAARVNSRFRAALVDGDRAMVLAAQGRLAEAVTAADRMLPSLVRPPSGEYQRWGNAEGAAVSLAVSRHCSHAGDLMTAQRMLAFGTVAAPNAGDEYLIGHLQLARATYLAAEGIFDDAEVDFVAAAQTFQELGDVPAVALTALEQGRAAARRGLVYSARPMLEWAEHEFRRLGQPRESAEIHRLLSMQVSSPPPR